MAGQHYRRHRYELSWRFNGRPPIPPLPGETPCSWVLEHTVDWGAEPATDLKPIAAPGGGAYLDRDGISWLLFTAGNLEPGDTWALVPGSGMEFDFAAWDDEVFKDGEVLFDLANTAMASVIAMGGGPPLAPTDPLWIVYHWDNIDYAANVWTGFAGLFDSGDLWGPDPAWLWSSAGPSPRRRPDFPGEYYIEIDVGDPVGFSYDQFAHAPPDTECFLGCALAVYALGMRYGTTRPSIPEDLDLIDTSEVYTFQKVFNDPVYQLGEGPGPMPDFFVFLQGLAGAFGPASGRMRCRLRSIRIYRWREPT